MGFAEGSTTEYALVAKARACNTWKGRVALWIWENQDTWDFDDSGYTTFPIATTTLVASQDDYTLPSSALKLTRAEVLDSSGNYQKLISIDDTQVKISLSEFEETDGLPRYYRLIGKSIVLYPAPAAASVTLAAGIKIYLAREVNEFTGATTTTEIGFGEPLDRAVAIGVAWEFASKKGMGVANDLLFQLFGGVKNGKLIPGLKDEIENHVSKRSKDTPLRFQPHRVNYI